MPKNRTEYFKRYQKENATKLQTYNQWYYLNVTKPKRDAKRALQKATQPYQAEGEPK